MGLASGLALSRKTIISAGQINTALTLSADADAPEPAKTMALKLIAEATVDGRHIQSEKIGGVPKLLPLGDLTAATVESRVAIKPGDQVWVTAKIERRNGFKGRVPLDVRGLPHGVRVLDVGLNGIMITGKRNEPPIPALYAEPWVEAARHCLSWYWHETKRRARRSRRSRWFWRS